MTVENLRQIHRKAADAANTYHFILHHFYKEKKSKKKKKATKILMHTTTQMSIMLRSQKQKTVWYMIPFL